jgi:hypothetical protein
MRSIREFPLKEGFFTTYKDVVIDGNIILEEFKDKYIEHQSTIEMGKEFPNNNYSKLFL